MIKPIALAGIAALLSLAALADDALTVEHIQGVIDATDAAAMQRDTQAIGRHLSSDFEKKVELPYQGRQASITLNKEEYLELIDQGWEQLQEYSYRREDTVIHIASDGLSGESSSTLTEHMVVNSKPSVSKVREYTHYSLEDGKALITRVESHELVGDTTPDAEP